MQNYDLMSDIEKYATLELLYIKENKSFATIAKMYDTYPNKLRRDAQKFSIPIRTKSEAQKNALESGVHKHPTKGKKRSEETKEKIGSSVMKNWDGLSEKQLTQRKKKAKENWEKLTEDEKANRLQSSNEAVRRTSKMGSKLENFLLNKLLHQQYKVVPHKEQILSNTKLHIDLFLPTANIAIEVDGPSHFAPIWGEEALKRNKEYDIKKNGLILGKGLKLIRIKQTKDFSVARANLILGRLLEAIDKIGKGEKFIEIGDE